MFHLEWNHPLQDCELLPEDLEKLVKSYKAVVQLELGEEFPEDPKAQLWGAVGAVFNSWMNQRAKTYRPPVIVRGKAREDLETIQIGDLTIVGCFESPI